MRIIIWLRIKGERYQFPIKKNILNELLTTSLRERNSLFELENIYLKPLPEAVRKKK